MQRSSDHDKPLCGTRILILEDEFVIAIGIEDTFRDAGADIVSAATVPAALKAIAEEELSGALLDVRLGRETSEPVADALAARGIPFLFHSGQALPDHLRTKFPAVKVLAKPLRQDRFLQAMVELVR